MRNTKLNIILKTENKRNKQYHLNIIIQLYAVVL